MLLHLDDMKMYKRSWQQVVEADMPEVWEFFSRPENLIRLTPEDMDIEVITDINGVEMHEGMIIDYVMTPVPRIKTKWTTRITKIEKFKYFIDVQEKGPYKKWHHEHHFRQGDEGILMSDIVYYSMPLGFLGDIANSIYINARLNDIFAYRKQAIDEIFHGKDQ